MLIYYFVLAMYNELVATKLDYTIQVNELLPQN